ncbi:hypothetical protein FOCC_FOCC015231 [Frankliniella occidentalis]|nr:hypothetical protein FOCC_FOCC015231 [Frankliniella occidentalis]
MGGSNAQMTPMELPRDMVILWMEARFTQTVCILESNFHPGATGLQHVTKQLSAALAISLHNTFFLCSSITSTTSFWRHDGAFYSFNTERANSAGVVDQQNELENKVRVFRYGTLDSLVQALCLAAGSSSFHVYRLKVIPLEDGKSKDEEQAQAYGTQGPTVALQPLNIDVSTSLTFTSADTRSVSQVKPSVPRNSVSTPAGPTGSPAVDQSCDKRDASEDEEGFQTVRKKGRSSRRVTSNQTKSVSHTSSEQTDTGETVSHSADPLRFSAVRDILQTTSVSTGDISAQPVRRKNKSPKKVQRSRSNGSSLTSSMLSDAAGVSTVSTDPDDTSSVELVPQTHGSSSESEGGQPARNKGGRPKKIKRGRPKVSLLTLAEQRNEASKRYNKKQPDVNRAAVARYTAENPEIHRAAVARYTAENPEINRAAVARYTVGNPEINRAAVARYTAENPEINRAAVAQYSANNPQVNRAAVRQYERATVRHLPPELRRSNLIGEFQGDELNKVSEYKLKNPSLLSPTCAQCPHCKARLFNEESDRKAWCCKGGAFNVLKDIPPLDADFYSNPAFLQNPRLFNDAYAFSALVIPQGFHHPRRGLAFIKIQGRVYHRVFDINWQGRFPNHSAMYIDDGQSRTANFFEPHSLDPFVATSISAYLNTCNPLIPLFRQLGSEESEEAHLVFENTTRQRDGPLFEQRTSREVAALICTDPSSYNPRKLTIWKKERNSFPQSIDSFHPLLEPFQYPLLYPHGTPGWHINRLDNYGRKLSQLDYTRCLILSQPRFSQFNRLSQTWLVDMYARYEEEKLNFIYHSQRDGAQSGGLRSAPLDEVRASVDSVRPLRIPPSAPDNSNTPPASSRGRGRGRGRGSNTGWGARRPAEETIRAPGATPAHALPGNRPFVNQVLSEINTNETITGEGGAVPGRIYLPESFTGGPRYMKNRYQDAMAIVGRLGNPSYFLTITANAKWDEITQSTHPDNPSGEPAVISRVFQLKLLELLRDLKSGAFFGKKAYIIYVIEFQKRGLPHAHVAFRVENGAMQTSEVDRVIRANIPSEDEAGGRLKALVLQHMVHGPCANRTNLPCWDEDRRACSKFFPKPHTDVTHVDERGFWHYQRNSENTATKEYRGQTVTISDCDIVPYNAALLLKYNCHLNVEIASTRKIIHYLFKYMTKGTPLTRVFVAREEDNGDEVEQYITRRHIGASDAAWRLLEFHVTGRDPTVQQLPIHLQDRQYVLFRPGEEADAIENSSSPLIQYFTRPNTPEFDNLTYLDFHEKYNLLTKEPTNSRNPVIPHPNGTHFIRKRSKEDSKVCRMFWVAPNRGELFYLRVLLTHLPCRGFDDLCSRGGIGCTSLQGAARALGLVNDDDEYLAAMHEAAVFMTGPRLRGFFVLLCNVGAPVSNIWADDQLRNKICADLLERYPGSPDRAYNAALLEIDRALRRQGSELADHMLPSAQDDTTELGRERLLYDVQTLKDFVQRWEPDLSEEQKSVLKYVRDVCNPQCSDPPTSRLMFLDAPGGYGKSTLLQVVAADARSRGDIVLCVASSGIAALNLDGGTTAHSMFKLPLDLGDGTGYWNLRNTQQRADLIREAKLIIFDEISMAHKFLVEILDRSLRDLMGRNEVMGGKVCLFSGDFRQIPPVVPSAKTPSDVVFASLKCSHLWPHFRQFRLTQPQRTRGDDEYSSFLLSVGNDTLPQHVFGEGADTHRLMALPDIQALHKLDDLIQCVYPPNILRDPDACATRAILCAHNINVREVNNAVMAQLPGETHQLVSVDFVEQEMEGLDLDLETLHLAEGKGVPNHVINLKVGAVCLIMRNLNMAEKLVNGSKVIIERISPRLITVRKPGSQELIGIPRILFKFPVIDGSAVLMCRRQFPLQVCYGMTVHKSQGQTIAKAGIDLRSDCFTHGQLYVALSRTRRAEHLSVLVSHDRLMNGTTYVKNIVYQELLHDTHPP